MSDNELDTIRRKKLLKRKLERQRKLAAKEAKGEVVGSDQILNNVFKGRAWEVFNAASSQFPQIMSKVRNLLVERASAGRIQEITGEQLLTFLRDMGLRVKLETKIEFSSHGELEPVAEKLQSELRKT